MKITNQACKCDPESWCVEVPAICEKFEADPVGMCLTCEHEEACHLLPIPINAIDTGVLAINILITMYLENSINSNQKVLDMLKKHSKEIRDYLYQVKK